MIGYTPREAEALHHKIDLTTSKVNDSITELTRLLTDHTSNADLTYLHEQILTIGHELHDTVERRRQPRTPAQIARIACREAKDAGVVRMFDVRRGGRATIYPAEGRDGYPGKFYTDGTLDTLACLRRLGYES